MLDERDPSASRADTTRIKRLPGSCDRCWKKKVRCDRATMDGVCTNCLNVKAECTHARRKGTKNGSINIARSAKEHVSKILSTSMIYIPSTDPGATHKILVEVAQYARSLEEQVATLHSQALKAARLARLKHPETPDSASSEEENESEPVPSSDSQIFPSARFKDRDVPLTRTTRSFQFVRAVLKHVPENTRPMLNLPWQRPEFWTRQPWETFISKDSKPQAQIFPQKDLLDALVELYFTKINTILNLLHSPSFRKSLSENQHHANPHFGAVVLGVCALASRFSDDPRVLMDGTADEHSSGWRWFSQVRPIRVVAWSEHPSSLYQLQLVCLSLSFISATCMATRDECWLLAGVGLRFAQAAGVHSRFGIGYARPGLSKLDAELYRRSVWMLTLYDSLMSSFQGRPSMANVDRLDLELPSQILEEEEENIIPLSDRPRPNGPPSEIEVMRAYIPLAKIIWRIHETLYLADRERRPVSSEAIVDLDSALNKWAAEIPDHLKWDTNQENPAFVDQSTVLHVTYYHAQIILHRALLPIVGRQAPPTSNRVEFPSLSICANAARSCVRVVEGQSKRVNGLVHHPALTMNLFDAAIILILSVLSGRDKIKSHDDFSRATADLESCTRCLRLYEKRWPLAGRRRDAIFLGLRLVKFALFDAGAGFNPPSSLFRGNTAETQDAYEPPHGPSSIFVESPSTFERRSDPAMEMQIRALEESMASTSHLFPPQLDPSFAPSHDHVYDPDRSMLNAIPIDDSESMDMNIDLEAMFAAGFSPEQLFGLGSHNSNAWPNEDHPNSNPNADVLGDPWNVFSGSYGWGDWGSYRMDSE
ncbi:fungal-specific transcription factor domain-containing protein [Mycena amicta]|nr:fungal-specific transcription factor domain-containing protein [Mycena amicta]